MILKPNSKYFESTDFNHRELVERLMFVQSIFDLKGFEFNNKPIPAIPFRNLIKKPKMEEAKQKLILKRAKSGSTRGACRR